VTYGDNTGYGKTLSDALTDLQTPGDVGASIDTSGGSTTPPPTSTSTTPPPGGSTSTTSAPPPSKSIDQLLSELQQAYAALNAAYNSHDQSKIGAAQAKVNEIAGELAAAQKSSSSTAPKPTPSPSR